LDENSSHPTDLDGTEASESGTIQAGKYEAKRRNEKLGREENGTIGIEE
jgi:hypothetical protein